MQLNDLYKHAYSRYRFSWRCKVELLLSAIDDVVQSKQNLDSLHGFANLHRFVLGKEHISNNLSCVCGKMVFFFKMIFEPFVGIFELMLIYYYAKPWLYPAFCARQSNFLLHCLHDTKDFIILRLLKTMTCTRPMMQFFKLTIWWDSATVLSRKFIHLQ